MSEYFLLFVPYLALVTRVWVGTNMMIHGYSKLRNMKQTAEETKKLGIPVGATYTATILEFIDGLFLIIGLIVPIIGLFFAIFYDRKCYHEENKDECGIHCHWQSLVRN